MYQAWPNGNHLTLSHHRRRFPHLFDSFSSQNVPDINLECTETIDWDDFESGNNSIYSPVNTEKLPKAEEDTGTLDDISSANFPPPNSPVSVCHNDPSDLFRNSLYVESLLQMWRDEVEPNISRSTGLQQSDKSIEEPIGNQNHGVECSDERSSSVQSPVDPSTDLRDLLTRDGVSFESSTVTMQPLSQSSPRSTSPAEIEALSSSVLGLSFDNLRSISPRIQRSPSPINSRSSSPRYLRSPSPFQVLDTSSHRFQADSSMDSWVFYDDRYQVRTHSPRQYVDEHLVPDVDMEFQTIVSDSEEFPSFTSYSRRLLNSCQDQVVPEYIEE
ncbi:uncharacterized protein LOC127871849 [Dreissena polymorpha]|uniref:Uncharacterized protein n=1 Tax=Dreissena polymorpha TaxID=45954 RepID=A0A9D4LKV6_DREPO|nr:uncharacterized protein LOC127871849 [Dreissena polymorpha]KAH3859302.1 hypothetical protein DPMN_102020 [Dreissena polymorpha]